MTNFSEARFTIRAVNRTQKAFAEIQGGIKRIERRFGGLGRALKSKVGPALAAVTAAFAGRAIVGTITQFEKLEASLRTVTGSADKASMAFKFLQDFAAKTPFQLEEMVAAFIKLKALGLKPSEEALRSYGNTASAMGKTLNQMIEAVADAATGEFERLKEFGIKARTQGEQVTFTFQGVSTTIGKNATEIEAYLRSIGDVQFAGAMAEQADTLNVALSNMGDSFSKLVKAIGDAGLTDLLKLIADGIRWLAEQITASIGPMKMAIGFYLTEIRKFANLFMALFKGISRAFEVFSEGLTARFEALGQDLANFLQNPLGGISFENTRTAIETGLLDAMGEAFDSAFKEADRLNTELDAKLKSLLMGNKDNKGNSLNAPLTPLTPQKSNALANLEEESKQTAMTIENQFQMVGKSLEQSFGEALSGISFEFKSFGDFAKSFLRDLAGSFLKNLTAGGASGGFGNLLSGAASLFGGFFADGGQVRGHRPIVVGERGPELFVPNGSGRIIPNHRLEGAGGVNVVVNMNVQTPNVQSFRYSQSQIAADLARSISKAQRNL